MECKTIPPRAVSTSGTGSTSYSVGGRLGTAAAAALDRAYSEALGKLKKNNDAAARTVCAGLCPEPCRCSIQRDDGGAFWGKIIAYLTGSWSKGPNSITYTSTGVGGVWDAKLGGSVVATCV
jgi:hypothetical protein